jgi:RNA polymerase sigma factor (sigma-70 family)
MPNEELALVKKCLKNNKSAQELLYRRHAAKMFGVCLRYTQSKMDAEDVLQEAFIRVFRYLKDYKGKGSLEGWIRRVVVNTAINFYRANLKHMQQQELTDYAKDTKLSNTIIDELTINELLDYIRNLPEGYRMVFNLYVIEGYTHKEIADQLGVSESTSKTQLLRARKALREMITKQNEFLIQS